jgi:cell division protein FtsI/penicillin-binding protein 2
MGITRRTILKTVLLMPTMTTGTAIVMRLKDRQILHIENPAFAAHALLPPASTIKPLAILALLQSGKLHQDDEFPCPRHLQINGHLLNCVHPQIPVPMNPARAIAYSCNGAVAHYAQRFAADEFPQSLIRFGFTSQTRILKDDEATGIVARNTIGPACQLQSLGEEGIAITPCELLLAYARLSTQPAILEGLEGAVEYGTAQAAQIPGIKVAGKTGSIILRSGSPAAWFAGFAPSRNPKLAVLVLTAGHSGGADAAPIAADLLKHYLNA